MDLSLISQAIMAVWSLLFGVIMFPFRTLQSWQIPVKAEPYDYFLSFSGLDTRRNFVNPFYRKLVMGGFNPFSDDMELEKGKEIGSMLFKAINETKIFIIIFSVNYASSKWCLNELAQIMECCKDQQRILPFFYHVDPHDVQEQTGDFGNNFEKLAERSDAKTVENWRKALKKAGGLQGLDFNNV